MSASDLLRRLGEAATPGPWEARQGHEHWDWQIAQPAGWVLDGDGKEEADARLIATLRTLLPELRAVEEAEAMRDSYGVSSDLVAALGALDEKADGL